MVFAITMVWTHFTRAEETRVPKKKNGESTRPDVQKGTPEERLELDKCCRMS